MKKRCITVVIVLCLIVSSLFITTAGEEDDLPRVFQDTETNDTF